MRACRVVVFILSGGVRVVCRFVCVYVWCVKQKATFFATGHASF